MSDRGCLSPASALLARSFVASRWAGGDSPQALMNPADLAECIGHVQLADGVLAQAAMESAAEAWLAWRRRRHEERLAPLVTALDFLDARRDAVARTITRENGKTLRESHAEIDAAIRDGRYQLRLTHELPARVQAERFNAEVHSELWHEPIGVFLLITPWNFPLATIVRKLIPAIAWGNTVVVKPAGITPLTAAAWFETLDEAGLPTGVANLVLGKSSVVASTLIDHPALRGVSFTGSTAVGLEICQRVAARDVRLQMELGGKNALVVMADADLEAAVEAATFAAFSCAGQWCVSTSRVIVEQPAYRRFTDALCERVARIRVGNGLSDTTDMGPVISADQLAEVEQAIQTANTEGAQLVCGGHTMPTLDGVRGYYVQPTIFADVTERMQLATEEVFGPVLAVMQARDCDEAVRLVNATEYGLSFSVYTKDDQVAERFMREIEAGMCHVNLPTPYREPDLPLSGWRQSGRGVPECGRYAREFYTRSKVVYRAIR